MPTILPDNIQSKIKRIHYSGQQEFWCQEAKHVFWVNLMVLIPNMTFVFHGYLPFLMYCLENKDQFKILADGKIQLIKVVETCHYLPATQS